MPMRVVLATVALVWLVVSTHTFAWGDSGHQLVARIAARSVSSTVKGHIVRDFHDRRCSSIAPNRAIVADRPDPGFCREFRPGARVLKSSRLLRRMPSPADRGR